MRDSAALDTITDEDMAFAARATPETTDGR